MLYKNLYTKKIKYTKKNLIKVNFSKNIYYDLNNFFFLKLNYHYNNKFIVFFREKKNFYFTFNYLNKLYFNNFNYFINNIFYSNTNNNFLILDNDQKNIIPIYNYIFGEKNIRLNKNFFCINKFLLTRTNWIFFFKSNIKKFKINFLFFLDYCEFSKFFLIFTKFNVPILSIIPYNFKNPYIDYFFYHNLDSKISKIIILNYITNIYFYNYNKNTLIIKKKHFFLMNKFFNNLLK